MKKVITMALAFVSSAACSSAPTPAPRPMASASAAPSGLAGGADAAGAVRGFMSAAKLQSVQSLAMWWGSANGPSRDAMPHDELEKRELIMLKCLKHDRYDVVGDAPSTGGARDMVLNVVYRATSTTTHLTVVPGPQNRWYVQDVDLQSLHAVCVA